MNRIRVCFLGTPDFAATHLQALLQNSQYELVGVVTQPDRPAGRKMQLTPSAVKILALENQLTVVTPENLRQEPEIFETIKSWKADIAIVVAFGQILSQDFLNCFEYGAVNIHGSLLPRWRGAAPIQRALEAGDLVSGVSLQKIVKKLDAGAVIAERRLALDSEINATELYQKLARLGCELLNNELLKYIRGEIKATEQDESKVTLAAKIEKEESLLTFTSSAWQIHHKVRAFTMGPGTYVMLQNKRLKIHKTKVIDEHFKGDSGKIYSVGAQELIIETSAGLISLLEVQPESKPRLNISEFLKTNIFKKGDRFV